MSPRRPLRALRALGLSAALCLAAALTAPAFAQPQTPPPTPSGMPASAELGDAAPAKVAETFEASPHLEPMRYRHLWIAYGAIWLLVFVFVFRTWRTSQQTSAELDGLKRRLAELEGRSPGAQGGPDGD